MLIFKLLSVKYHPLPDFIFIYWPIIYIIADIISFFNILLF